MSTALRIGWLLLAALHLLPALAAFRPAMLTRLYGVEAGSLTFTLLTHRAALFLVVLIIALWAAFDSRVRPLASVAVGVSMISFLLIYAQAGLPPQLRSIAVADLIGLPILAFVAWNAFAR